MPRIRPEGGLSGTYATPTTGRASGMWTMREMDTYIRQSAWPVDVGQADPYFNLNTLLVHADGNDNANNNTIIDGSTDKIPFTGTNSVYFDGASYATTTGVSLTSTTQPFTLECWVYPNAQLSGTGIVATNWPSSGTIPFILGSGTTPGNSTGSNLLIAYYNGTSWIGSATSTSLTVGVWSHLAVSYDGTTATLYLNGTSIGSYTGAWITTTNTTLNIGKRWDGSGYFNGYISNVRYVRGTAVYTGNFTPSTTPLTAISGTQVLTCQSSTLVDNSTNAYTVTTAAGTVYVSSGNYPVALTKTSNVGQGTFSPFSQSDGYWANYFDGTGDFLTTTGTSVYDMPSDFTIECWVFRHYNTQTYEIIAGRWITGTAIWMLNITSTGTALQFQYNNTSVTGSYAFEFGKWYHIAVARSGTSVKMFVNGTQVGTTLTTSYNFTNATRPIIIGRNADSTDGSQDWEGYISNFRIVIGTCLYPNNFNPPTSPLTAVSGTALLICQGNKFKDASSTNETLTISGTPNVVPFSPFAPPNTYSSSKGGSYAFNGSSEYMRIGTAQAALGFGTGDFTIECWVYFTSITQGCVFDTRTSGGASSQAKSTFYLSSSGNLSYYTGGASRITSAVVAGQWYHCAIVRSSGVTKFYLNGVVNSTTYTDTTDYGSSSQFTLGSWGDTLGSASGLLNGYISDVRVTKSAVYSANFTPPTSVLSPVSNTSILLSGTNATIIDQVGKNSLATVGGARISSTQKKFGTSSIVLNGTTDYIELNDFASSAIPASSLITSGDFTIEGWFFSNGSASTQTLFYINGLSTGFAAARLDWLTANTLQLLVSSSGTAWAINYTPAGALNSGQWYHIALVRSGSSFSLYVDGALKGAAQTLAGALTAGTGFQYIGTTFSTTYQNFFNGYVDEVRISRIARYTTNFTPSTQAFLDR